MRKKVFFIGALKEGGAERVISILTNEMACMGENVEILTYYDREVFYDIHKDVNIVCVEKETQGKSFLGKFFWIRRYFKKNAQVVISFLAPFNMFAIGAVLFSKVPIVVADRNDPRKVPSRFVIRKLRDFLYCFADGIVVQNTDNKKYFPRAVQKKSTVIFNPIDLGEKRGEALKTEKKKRIVSVGRLIKQKNQMMLLEAFAEIHREYPEYTLTIYGEGDYREKLEDKIRKLELENVADLPGSKKDVFKLISDAELFVLPSDYEGMPNALIEAMCLGLPVVSTAVSGTSDLIEDGVNGKIVDVGNKEQLVFAMREMLAYEATRSEYAQKAISTNDRLEVSGIVKEWKQFIEEIQ